jgi:hypothetical protein
MNPADPYREHCITYYLENVPDVLNVVTDRLDVSKGNSTSFKIKCQFV